MKRCGVMDIGHWVQGILHDANYVTLIKHVISEFLINNPRGHVSPHCLWETLKCIIRGESIQFCAQRKKIQNKQQLILESKISEMEMRLINDPQNRLWLTTSVNNAKNDLNQVIEFKAKGAAIRSRSRWVEYGEKILNSLLFGPWKMAQ